MNEFKKYYLTQNPFPQIAVIDPYEDDIKINGTIFCRDIFENQINDLKDKIEANTNLIYIAGLQFDRGVGKSALLIQEWRRLAARPQATSVYVKCQAKEKPYDLFLRVISEWHNKGYLWDVFRDILLNYSSQTNSLVFTREVIDTIFNVYKSPPDRLNLKLYAHIVDLKSIRTKITGWLKTIIGAENRALDFLIQTYMTEPNSLPEVVSRKKKDFLKVLDSVLRLLDHFGYKEHYIFLDQFEDSIMPVPSGKIPEFTLQMRRILEKTTKRAIIIVTLHPDSEMKINACAAGNLQTVAPIDKTRTVEIMTLIDKVDLSVKLVEEYLNHFRLGNPPSQLYPFDDEAIKLICYSNNGIIRSILQQLYNCLNFAISREAELIDLEFLKKYPNETVGMEIDAILEGFESEVK